MCLRGNFIIILRAFNNLPFQSGSPTPDFQETCNYHFTKYEPKQGAYTCCIRINRHRHAPTPVNKYHRYEKTTT